MLFEQYRLSDDKEIISGDKFLQFVNEKRKQFIPVCYVKNDYYRTGSSFVWRNRIHPEHLTKFVVSGHSDLGIDETIFNKYADGIEVWFSTNVNYRHPKLYSLPIGITNDCNDSPLHRIYGNTDVMLRVADRPSNRAHNTKLMYMNFNIDTYCDRPSIYKKFVHEPYVTVGQIDNTMQGRELFLTQLRNHKYCLCPRGNGIDTHRLWESLYMGTIPVVKREIAYEQFADLPILFVDDYSEITEQYLNEQYSKIMSTFWNMDKLNMTYWKNKINTVTNDLLSGL